MTLVNRIYRKVRYPINNLLYNIGAEKYLLRNRTGKRIMAYHGVDAVGSLAYNTRFISEHLFEQQIIYFKKNFHVVTLKEYYETNFTDDKLQITLTFDDGYANNFTRVLPILEKYQVPATFFVTAIRAKDFAYLWTDFYDMLRCVAQHLTFKDETYIKNNHNNFVSKKSGESLNAQLKKLPFQEIEEFMQQMTAQSGLKIDNFPADYHLQMTIEEIKALSESPFASIGSHSFTHADLTQRPLKEAIDEMKFSKEWLENITKKEIDAIAFPYGNYNLEVIEAAKTLGYRYLLPVQLNQESDEKIPELRKRFGNNPFLSLKNQIWCILNEQYL